jgi:hypothetical protein
MIDTRKGGTSPSSSDQPSEAKPKRAASEPLPIQSLFANYKIEDKGGYITQEFQDFGYRMAVELSDLEHKSLYMRMAKKYDRGLLERALSFVSDSNAKSKARLFMWKVKELKKEKTKEPPTNGQ